MNNLKKIKIMIAIAVILSSLFVLTGCTTNKSYTYNVDTGDKIKIEMKTGDGYDLTSELPIQFTKDDEVISQGTFAEMTAYDTYYELMDGQNNVEILEENENDNIEYFFYEYTYELDDQAEYNYIIKIKNSNTCFILGNNISKESAEEIFERLTFSVED